MSNSLRNLRVFVYRNLHKGCFSLKSTKTGLVVGRYASIAIQDAEFVVQKAGREKVLKEKRKNVHAGVRGKIELVSDLDAQVHGLVEVYYNPYKADHFYIKDTGERIDKAKWVLLTDNKVYVQNG